MVKKMVDARGSAIGKDGKQFCERLAELLPNRGDVPQLAAKTGVSVTTVRQWVRGEAVPGLDNLLATANALGVSVGWLSTGEGEKASEFPSIRVDPSKAAVDPRRLALVIAAVEELFEEVGGNAPPSERSELASRLYEQVWDMETEDEVRGGLTIAIRHEKERLRGG